MNSTWIQLNTEVRKLENEIELQLENYSKFSESYMQSSYLIENNYNDGYSNNDEDISNSLAIEINESLMNLSRIIKEMSKILSEGTHNHSLSENNSLILQLQNHRQKLQDYTTDFRQQKKKITNARNHADLLITVRNDINSFKEDGNNKSDILLRERSSLNSAGRSGESFIEAGEEVRSNLIKQNKVLNQSISSKFRDISGTFGSVDSIMNAIKRKKNRDCIILSLFISILITFLFWWWITS
eukprot:TRINITY_DN1123_c0_g2_i1.p1 TRINITY_DN1123_c0_g2~~TRINITY_DN1123_c0_g2_i1.p1  ORF type:complete len:242 (-),score=37.27 TRINITY_DN1123_c0_g2_i1:63-788(-)